MTVAPFIDGTLAATESDSCVDAINPSNGHRLFSIPTGSAADVDRAVAAARRAFDTGSWSDTPPSVKKQTLHRFADLIADEALVLDALDAEEMGKPVAEAFANATRAAGVMRFFAEAVDKVAGDVFASDKASFVAHRRIPRGVVAAIVPWNFPTYVAVLKLAPALAAGNCVVLKPSELSSRSAVRLAQLAIQAGLPPGALNVVPGLGQTVGQALGLHKDVDMLTFTGSTHVGKLMMQFAGQSNLKVVMAECGGKSPHIIFADGVDLGAASDAIARLLLTNQGQVCSVGSRVLVQRSIEQPLLDHITTRLKRITMGDPVDASTTYGPLASARQCATVMRYIDEAPSEGAELVTGGQRARQESGGYFVEPTVFRNVRSHARLAQDEVFGPVLSVTTFEDEAEAVRLANATPYALASYVWSTNLSTAMRMAKALRCTVRLNAVAPLGEGPGFAYSSEPAKLSGVGAEGGLPGLESYLRRQMLWINHA